MTKVTSRLGRLALRYDYVIVCRKLNKNATREDGSAMVELYDPVEYTSREAVEKYGDDTVVVGWVDTYAENGEPAMAVVLGGKKHE